MKRLEGEQGAVSRRKVLPFILLLIAWAIVTHRVWLLGETFYLRDFWTNYVPSRWLLRTSLSRGALPLWNPLIGGGLPTIADVNNSVFYLLGWPFLLPRNQAWALSLSVELHLLLAASGTYLLARRHASPKGALAAAAAFAFGGLMLSNRVDVHWHSAYCWIPLWFWLNGELLDRIGTKERIVPWFSALTLVWSAQLLASDPQTAYLEGLSFIVLIASRRLTGVFGWRAVLQATLVMLCSSALASAVASPQLWALWEALGQTDRFTLTDAGSGAWSFDLRRLWEFVVPLPWGELTPVTTFWGKALITGPWHNFYFASTYLGCLALPLGLIGLARWKPRATLPVLGLVVLVCAALGEATPLHHWLRQVLPVWQAFRYPERLLVLPTLGMAMVIARGVDCVDEGGGRLGWLMALPGILAGLLWLAPGLLGPGNDIAGARDSIARACLHSAVIAVVGLTISIWMRPAGWKGIALCALIFVDLLGVSPLLEGTGAIPEQKRLRFKEDERVLFSIADIDKALSSLPPKPELRRVFEDSISRPNLNILSNVPTTNGVTSLALRRSRILREGLGFEDAAIQFTTRTIIANADLDFRRFERAEILDHGLARFRFAGELRQVTCQKNWRQASSPEEALQALRKGQAVIEEPSDSKQRWGLEPMHSLNGANAVKCSLDRISPTEISVELPSTPSPVLVRVSESFYPGWTAYVGTDAVAVHPVDVAFLGAIVPPATTHVAFRYRPRWLRPLSCVSVASLLVLLLGFMIAKPLREFACHPGEDRIS